MNTTLYIKTLWRKIRHRKRLILFVMLTSILSTACLLSLPLLIQHTLDNQILSLTKEPFYSTIDLSGVAINSQKWTQDESLATSKERKAIVVYEGTTAYFVSNIDAKITENIELHQQQAVTLSGQKLKDVKIYALTKDDIYQLYTPKIKELQISMIFYALIAILYPLFAFLNTSNVKKLARNIIADFRIEGMNKLQKLPIDYFTKSQDGKFISYLMSDVSMFYSLATNVGMQLLQALVTFIGIYIMLAFVDLKLFVGALIVLPLIVLWMHLFRKYILGYYEKARHASSSLNALLNEQFKGISVIRAFNYHKNAEAEFNEFNDAVYKYNEKSLKLRSFSTGSVVNVLRRGLWIFILFYAGSQYFQLGLIGVSIGTIYLLVSLVNYYVQPLYDFFSIITTVEQSNVSIQRFFRYLEEEEEQEVPGCITTPMPKFLGKVDFVDLSFSYTENQPVLQGINLSVAAGQSVAIVGHTGSGKSSLMNLLLRFYEYQQGQILVDGNEIKQLDRSVYREHVGIILQDPILFKGTLLEAITWGDTHFTEAYIIDILHKIGAADLLEHPDGIHQQVIEMGENFSLGQRQLIAFARAIIQDPAILILDEATANIDTETERKIQTALAYVSQNRTTFVIAHRLSTVQHSDVIVVLDKGKVAEQGTHQELLSQQGKYWEMYEAQKQR